MYISSGFDGGNIDVISSEYPSDVRLSIRKDNQSDFYQWFYFRVAGAAGTSCEFTIENAAGAAYADGWPGYDVCASYDRETWFRVPTDYVGEKLIWGLTPETDCVYFAYFAPYSMERHADLIARTSLEPGVNAEVLGKTLDHQDLDMLQFSSPNPDAKPIWLIARQHPGETMAEWWMEGAAEFLTDLDNPHARVLREKATIYMVPNMNPDGSRRGHLRTNAVGANLNREWKDSSEKRSPEVHAVKAKMKETGVAFHLDVHGDEALPYNFIAGFEGIPSVTKKQLKLLDKYQTLLCQTSPDFQREHGYPIDEPGSSDLKKCTDYVAETYGCLAMTLEMPFKDNADLPDAMVGWNPARCKHLAAACLTALAQMIDDL